jgi:septal ring factor EnvC (AmiA/AmiB activator)
VKRHLLRAIRIAVLATAGMTVAHAEAPADLAARHSETSGEYERITSELSLSDARQKTLADEIARIRKDNASITTALIQAAKTEKKLSEDVAAMETRLSDLREQEDSIRLSLSERRGVLAEVLGALQRMGLNPPPAILVRPEDALSSVRSAILLGAVVPELRAETTILLADLKELSRVGETIAAERGRLVATITEQAEGRTRLSLLLDEKKKLQTGSEQTLKDEQLRAAKLASKAGNLKDLIASLDAGMEAARKAAEDARLAEEARVKREAESAERAVPEDNRLTSAAPFPALHGLLSLPVSGKKVLVFGHVDDAGVTAFGDTVRTQSGAIVTAPSDATVLYAGAFRSYGQLLILDAGGGYHVVLAGLGRISVSQGQTVLAGEPVGAMGETRIASVSPDDSVNAQPELYIEFRKDQKPVDPAPWWQERQPGRTGHDS